MFSSTARRLGQSCADEDAGPGAVSSASTRGQEEERRGRKCLHSIGMPDTMSGETEAPSSKDEGEGEGDIPSPHGRKRTASEDLEVGAPKRGKVSLPYGSGSEVDVIARHLSGDKPLAES